MEILRQALLVLHLLGFAALFGGLLVQGRQPEKSVNALMRDGAGTAFVAGLALVGVIEADGGSVDQTKVGVKALLGLVILVLVMANVRKQRIADGLWALLLLLTVANVCIAVFWASAHA
jgi:hypothetical protein